MGERTRVCVGGAVGGGSGVFYSMQEDGNVYKVLKHTKDGAETVIATKNKNDGYIKWGTNTSPAGLVLSNGVIAAKDSNDFHEKLSTYVGDTRPANEIIRAALNSPQAQEAPAPVVAPAAAPAAAAVPENPPERDEDKINQIIEEMEKLVIIYNQNIDKLGKGEKIEFHGKANLDSTDTVQSLQDSLNQLINNIEIQNRKIKKEIEGGWKTLADVDLVDIPTLATIEFNKLTNLVNDQNKFKKLVHDLDFQKLIIEVNHNNDKGQTDIVKLALLTLAKLHDKYYPITQEDIDEATKPGNSPLGISKALREDLLSRNEWIPRPKKEDGFDAWNDWQPHPNQSNWGKLYKILMTNIRDNLPIS